MSNTINRIVTDMLCCSCGTCAYICPNYAIKMQEHPSGLLNPEIDKDLCNECGLCIKVCPGNHLNNPLIKNIDPFKGDVVAAYCGQAADPQVLRNGQSGGIATTLLLHLLDTHAIDKAMVTEMPSDGSLKPICHLTCDKSTIKRTQGSKYCPVPLNSFLPKPSVWKKTNFAIVGLPCHFHGLSNVMALRNDLHPPLTIGLVCDRVMSYAVIDFLIGKSNLPKKSIRTLKYRDKQFGGWPGNVSVETKNAQTVGVDRRHRMWCKGYFTSPRCYLCFDKMNFSADIVLGDAWGFKREEEGLSIILARTPRGNQIIEKARQAGTIKIDRVNSEAVFNGQQIELKRKEWSALITAWQDMGHKSPDFGFSLKWYAEISGDSLSSNIKKLDKAIKLTKASSRSLLMRYARSRHWLSLVKQKTFSTLKSILPKRINHHEE